MRGGRGRQEKRKEIEAHAHVLRCNATDYDTEVKRCVVPRGALDGARWPQIVENDSLDAADKAAGDARQLALVEHALAVWRDARLAAALMPRVCQQPRQRGGDKQLQIVSWIGFVALPKVLDVGRVVLWVEGRRALRGCVAMASR